jgi:hypothetical protein
VAARLPGPSVFEPCTRGRARQFQSSVSGFAKLREQVGNRRAIETDMTLDALDALADLQI